MGAGHLFLTSNTDPEGPGPCPSGAMVPHIKGYLVPQKLYVINNYLVRLNPYCPDHCFKGGGGKRGPSGALEPFGRNFFVRDRLIGIGR